MLDTPSSCGGSCSGWRQKGGVTRSMSSDLVVIPRRRPNPVGGEIAIESGVPSHGWELLRGARRFRSIPQPCSGRAPRQRADHAVHRTTLGRYGRHDHDHHGLRGVVVGPGFCRAGSVEPLRRLAGDGMPVTCSSILGRISPACQRLVPGNAVFLVDLRIGDLLASASTIVRRKLKRAVSAGARAARRSPPHRGGSCASVPRDVCFG